MLLLTMYQCLTNCFLLPLFISFYIAILTAIFQCSSKEKKKQDSLFEQPISKQARASNCSNQSAVNKPEISNQKLTSEKLVSVATVSTLLKTQQDVANVPSSNKYPKPTHQQTPRLTASVPGENTKVKAPGKHPITKVLEPDAGADGGAICNAVDDLAVTRKESNEQVVSFPIPASPYSVFENTAGMSDTTDDNSKADAKKLIGKQVAKEQPFEMFKLPELNQQRLRVSGPVHPRDTEMCDKPLGQLHVQKVGKTNAEPAGKKLGKTDGQPIVKRSEPPVEKMKLQPVMKQSKPSLDLQIGKPNVQPSVEKQIGQNQQQQQNKQRQQQVQQKQQLGKQFCIPKAVEKNQYQGKNRFMDVKKV